jgi:hypothetical protein
METEKIWSPSKDIEKIFSIEARGNTPEEITLTVPTIISPDEPFDMKIAVIDQNGCPSFECDEIVCFEKPPVENCVSNLEFTKGKVAIAWLKNLICKKHGIHRIACKFNGKTFFSNPFMCNVNAGYKIFWGDPHVHTVLSDCHANMCRSTHFAYTAGRYLTGLDWMSVTDHVSNGRGTPGKWREGMLSAEYFNLPFEFVTIPGYEASFKGGSGGDNNIYFSKFPDYFVEDYENGTIKSVCDTLVKKADKQNFDFFVVPHHTSRTVKHGEISREIYPGKDLMPAIEIYSRWGSSEYEGNPESLLKPNQGPSYVIDFLKKGYIAGFIAGTDTHSTIPCGKGKENLTYPPGFTAVFSDTLERNSIFTAIRNRKTYATAKERIFIDFHINGINQGGIMQMSKNMTRKIAFTVAASSDINVVEIIRNGNMIFSSNPATWLYKEQVEDDEQINNICLESEINGKFIFYYLRVRTSIDGLAWSSPVFVLLQ